MPQVKRARTAKASAAPASAAVLAPVPAPPKTGLAVAGRIVAFLFAGGIGFGVDMLGTLTLINFGLHPLVARAIAILAALLATYAINRGITFRTQASHQTKGVALEGLRYLAVGLATSLLNWLVYAAVLALAPMLGPPVALVIGSAAAMLASYLGYAYFAFRG